MGGILLAIAAVRAGLECGTAPLRGVEGVLAGIGAAFDIRPAAPARLAPLNRAWTRLGLLLFKVVNPVVLGLIYLTTIVPIGLPCAWQARSAEPQVRPAGRELLGGATPGPAPETMIRQF